MDATLLIFAALVVIALAAIAFVAGSSLNQRLDALSKRLGDGLSEQTKETGEQLKSLHERLAVIDSAQKNITDLSQQMVGLQDILSNKQARGAFGEFQMESLIKDFLPPSAFEFQATLSNGTRVDCLIRLPSPPGTIPIDSKFPLEAYRAIQMAKSDAEKINANREFSKDVGLHIKAIAEKYVIPGETDWAIMFLPSEAIFAELNSNFANVVEDAQRRRVGFASPSTLMALVNTVSAILKDGQMREQAGLIQKQVELMLNDVRLLDERVGKLKTHFRQAGEDIDGIAISSGKITGRGQKIEDVQLEEEDSPETLEAPRPRLKEV
jgi:DNA recombination protein RmuC|tara:strand:+ start:2214 stop:3185 length:972 start_codon:yes stop_codon:yes gene_type:complete